MFFILEPSNEFVAVRGFGQSVWAALGPALFSAFLFGMLFVTVINPIGAVTSKRKHTKRKWLRFLGKRIKAFLFLLTEFGYVIRLKMG